MRPTDRAAIPKGRATHGGGQAWWGDKDGVTQEVSI